jgi:hypothetical protein
MEMSTDKERWATERAALLRRQRQAEEQAKRVLEEKEQLKQSLQVSLPPRSSLTQASASTRTHLESTPPLMYRAVARSSPARSIRAVYRPGGIDRPDRPGRPGRPPG